MVDCLTLFLFHVDNLRGQPNSCVLIELRKPILNHSDKIEFMCLQNWTHVQLENCRGFKYSEHKEQTKEA